ncbi:hypothetical protein [Actinoplanes sp. G11-F43]|uniref:hypothetical protein n=1 Tax=Actinoplanes sp. G11-F43 TaxID=3424130 RepID=UPI003D329A1B
MKCESYKLAFEELQNGNRDRARTLLAECHERSGENFMPYRAIGSAAVASADGDHPLAARMIGVADRAFAETGLAVDDEDAAEMARIRAAAIASFGEDRFADERADGSLWEPATVIW